MYSTKINRLADESGELQAKFEKKESDFEAKEQELRKTKNELEEKNS